ncbi:hypothetical protein FA15DRAFT_172183 [Coprinopsis marcescibilis]|uniref:Uncharacterized protein n=1 Tax=Coprinopsis marcescibilis TaxID=230819 RepID=A0A5C3KHB6_COPMA|nr:hypothetical protein FA15DRAFT_172183 [Coprinopsis marcescibilis]
MTTTVILLSEAILFIRVYAISGRSIGISCYLLFHFIAAHLGQFFLMAQFQGTLKNQQSPLLGKLTCFTIPSATSNRWLAAVFVVLVASATVLALIMCWICFHRFRHGHSTVSAIFFRDGFVYFFFVMMISLANIIVNATSRPSLNLFLTGFQGAFNSILATRMVLLLRQAVDPDSETSVLIGWSQYPAGITNAVDGGILTTLPAIEFAVVISAGNEDKLRM